MNARENKSDSSCLRLQERLFDPPGLGIPEGYAAKGQAAGDAGRLEVFVSVADGVIVDVGYLTDIDALAMACASVWRELCLGKTPVKAVRCDSRDILRRLPELPPEAAPLLELCLKAGQEALRPLIRD